MTKKEYVAIANMIRTCVIDHEARSLHRETCCERAGDEVLEDITQRIANIMANYTRGFDRDRWIRYVDTGVDTKARV